jgi:uncharacterized protein YidB (DUF937 family)
MTPIDAITAVYPCRRILEELKMGLLDQILGGLTGGAAGNAPDRRGGMGSRVLMALLPVVIGMLSHRGGGLGGMSGMRVSGGGLGGLGGLGGMGGLGGAGGLGGLGGLLEQFTNKGYGAQANSWIGTGPNDALSPQAVGDVFGEDQIAQIAQQAGVSPDDARNGLTELLPPLVDHLTPGGEVPGFDQMSSSVDEFVRRLNS